MIRLSRLNGEEFVLNSNMIEMIEANPDTVISLVTGHKLVVRESADEVIEKVMRYNAETGAIIKTIKGEV